MKINVKYADVLCLKQMFGPSCQNPISCSPDGLPPQHYPRASWKHKGVIRIASQAFRPVVLEVFVRRIKNRKCPNPKESDCFWYKMLVAEHLPLVVLDRIGNGGLSAAMVFPGASIRHLDDFQQHPDCYSHKVAVSTAPTTAQSLTPKSHLRQ